VEPRRRCNCWVWKIGTTIKRYINQSGSPNIASSPVILHFTKTKSLRLLSSTITMKFSIGLVSILFTSALATSVKRQNDVPACVNGKGVRGPYGTSE
jgi:hypothetical protein